MPSVLFEQELPVVGFHFGMRLKLTWKASWIISDQPVPKARVWDVVCVNWWNSSMCRRFTVASASWRGLSSRCEVGDGAGVSSLLATGDSTREHDSRLFSQLLHGAPSSHYTKTCLTS